MNRSPIARRAGELGRYFRLERSDATALAVDEHDPLHEPLADADAWADPDSWRENID